VTDFIANYKSQLFEILDARVLDRAPKILIDNEVNLM
jgi:hypothetical protein